MRKLIFGLFVLVASVAVFGVACGSSGSEYQKTELVFVEGDEPFPVLYKQETMNLKESSREGTRYSVRVQNGDSEIEIRIIDFGNDGAANIIIWTDDRVQILAFDNNILKLEGEEDKPREYFATLILSADDDDFAGFITALRTVRQEIGVKRYTRQDDNGEESIELNFSASGFWDKNDIYHQGFVTHYYLSAKTAQELLAQADFMLAQLRTLEK